MQNNRNFIDELKHQYRSGGMHIKLIFANILFFLVIALFTVAANLSQVQEIGKISQDIFSLQTDVNVFLTHPWGLFTSIFAHYDLIHLLINMLMLYFAGSIFSQYFRPGTLLAIYLLGGITGGLFEILAHSVIPALADKDIVVVGASGSIMAIFIGLAFYRPNLPVSLFGVLTFPIIYLALAYLLIDFVSLGLNDGTAHFAHVGGAVIGIIFSMNTANNSNIVFSFERMLSKIQAFFASLFKPGSRTKKKDVRKMSDEEFNLDKAARQKKTNEILDKISKSGYESLTKAEKDFLFRQSNNA